MELSNGGSFPFQMAFHVFKHGNNYPDIHSLKQVIIETVNNIPRQMIHDSINGFCNVFSNKLSRITVYL